MKKPLKKAICLLMALLLALSTAACGGSEGGTPSQKSETQSSAAPTEQGSNTAAPGEPVSTPEPAEPTPESTPEPTQEPVEYLRPENAQDGLFWGDNPNYPGDIVMNAKGEVVFTLPEGVHFYTGDLKLGATKPAFYCDYGILDNDTIIDKKGNVLFDLTASEFDRITFMNCLDVGYILCSKDVNTFEETGTHYYAVCIADGTSFSVDLEENEGPLMVEDNHWHYTGNGNFLYAPPNGGSAGPQWVYHLPTQTIIPCSRTTKDGEETDRVTNMYFLELGYRIYGTELRYFDVDSHTMFYGKYDMATGKAVEVDAAGIEGLGGYRELREGRSFDDVPDIVEIRAADEDYDWTSILFDCAIEKVIPTQDYASAEVIAKSEDGLYLLYVENAGGGHFATVCDADGNRLFEPINGKPKPLGDYFLVTYDEVNSVYDWHGNLKCEIPTLGFQMGSHTMIYSTLYPDDSGVDTFLLELETGETIPLDPSVIDDSSDVEAFSEGYYLVDVDSVFGGALIDEEGNVTYLVLPPQ